MSRLPLSVWRLMLAYSLMMAGVPLMVLIAGIIGTDFAPSEGLATLPIALGVVGVASATLPTGRLMQRFGRRRVFLGYGLVAIAAALLGALSLVRDWFVLFCLGAYLMGWSAAAAHQYRFAALELVRPDLAPRATSVLLLGGILAAFVGPELAVRGRYLLQTEYAGSFLLLTGSYLAGMAIVTFYRERERVESREAGRGRPIREILKSPPILIAIGAAAIAYGVMSFLMTATPISMHKHAAHSLEATKWVIQSHIAAMYLPALVYARLFARLGHRNMVWTGLGIYLLCLLVAAWNTAILHFWLALVLLGVGWNFLFLTGTNLLPAGYRPEERFRVQSVNDFVVFSVQAIASLGSGWVLHRAHWNGVIWVCVPPVVAFGLFLWAGQKRALAQSPHV